VHERGYPPTPYRGDRKRTLIYRDGWDDGWQWAKERGVRHALEHWKARGGQDNQEPRHVGFGQGLRARYEWMERREAEDREWRRQQAVERARMRAEGRRYPWEEPEAEERPY